MFDPHRTRRSDRRYFTRKGQVLQASRVNTKPVIEQRLVPVYQDYLELNGFVNIPRPVDPFSRKVIGISFNNVKYPFSEMNKTTDPSVTLTYHGAGLSAGVLMYFWEDEEKEKVSLAIDTNGGTGSGSE